MDLKQIRKKYQGKCYMSELGDNIVYYKVISIKLSELDDDSMHNYDLIWYFMKDLYCFKNKTIISEHGLRNSFDHLKKISLNKFNSIKKLCIISSSINDGVHNL